MSGRTIDGVVLDHVAHAVHHWQDVWHRYAVDLGADWSSGGLATGFAPGQIEFANGARLELLMPNDVEANDFLHRFLAAGGPGPHHLTFKVPDLVLAIEQIRGAGYEPIGIDLSAPEWMETFIHPKQATGIVLQLAQAPSPWTGPPPDGFPTEKRQRRDGAGAARPASLLLATHVVADLEVATALFVVLLGGEITAEGGEDDHRWMELSWGGPMGLRLVHPTGPSPSPLGDWLGGRSGRLHHLEFQVDDAGEVPGARPDEVALGANRDRGAIWVIPPEENEGMRLVLRDR
jgi:hypothetical protein